MAGSCAHIPTAVVALRPKLRRDDRIEIICLKLESIFHAEAPGTNTCFAFLCAFATLREICLFEPDLQHARRRIMLDEQIVILGQRLA